MRPVTQQHAKHQPEPTLTVDISQTKSQKKKFPRNYKLRTTESHAFHSRGFQRNSKNSFIPSLLDHSDKLVADDSGKAELLNSFFVRQSSWSASTEEPPTVNTEPVLDSSQTLEKFEVSISDVLQVLRTVDSKKAPGFDGIPTRLITMLAKEIAPCVHHIFSN